MNLALADLIGTMVVPLKMCMELMQYSFLPIGDTGCKIISFLPMTTITVSSLTLLIISIDRYIIVRWPFRKVLIIYHNTPAPCAGNTSLILARYCNIWLFQKKNCTPPVADIDFQSNLTWPPFFLEKPIFADVFFFSFFFVCFVFLYWGCSPPKCASQMFCLSKLKNPPKILLKNRYFS